MRNAQVHNLQCEMHNAQIQCALHNAQCRLQVHNANHTLHAANCTFSFSLCALHLMLCLFHTVCTHCTQYTVLRLCVHGNISSADHCPLFPETGPQGPGPNDIRRKSYVIVCMSCEFCMKEKFGQAETMVLYSNQ